MSNNKKNKQFNQREYEKKWHKQNYKRIPLDVTLTFANTIAEHIKLTGESRNAFIKRAIKTTIELDTKNN